MYVIFVIYTKFGLSDENYEKVRIFTHTSWAVVTCISLLYIYITVTLNKASCTIWGIAFQVQGVYSLQQKNTVRELGRNTENTDSHYRIRLQLNVLMTSRIVITQQTIVPYNNNLMFSKSPQVVPNIINELKLNTPQHQ